MHAIMSHLGCSAVCVPGVLDELPPSLAALLSSSFLVGATLSMAVLFKRSTSSDLVLSVFAVLGFSIFLGASTIGKAAGGSADTATL